MAAALLADNVEEEYLWSTSLNSTNKVQHDILICIQPKKWRKSDPSPITKNTSGKPHSLLETRFNLIDCFVSLNSKSLAYIDGNLAYTYKV